MLTRPPHLTMRLKSITYYNITTSHTVNTGSPNGELMLGQRHKWWANANSTLIQRIVFAAGLYPANTCTQQTQNISITFIQRRSNIV